MTIHPAIQAMLQKARQAGVPALSAGSPAEARALMAATRPALGTGVPVRSCEPVRVSTRGGGIAGTLLLPEGRPAGLVVYLHGGGWVIGSPADFEVLARSLVAQSGCAVLLPDYRLAPEHPFPAGLEDAEDALLWAWQERERLIGHPGPLVAAGDSAGGNYAAVAARTLQDQLRLSGQVLIYPVTDCEFDTPSYLAYGAGLVLTRQDMEWFFRHYALPGAWADPRIAPLRAASLAGLPEAVVVLAEYDALHDEGAAYAALLEEAGVPVTLRRYPGMTHGFIRLHNLVDTAGQAVREVAADLRALCSTKPG